MPVGPDWQRQPQIMNGIFFSRYHMDFDSENGNFDCRKIYPNQNRGKYSKHIVMLVLYI